MKKSLIIILFTISFSINTFSQSWELITKENTNLPISTIDNIVFDASDNLWINAYSSVYMFDDEKQEWITFNKSNSQIGEKINSLYRDNQDNIWAAGEAIYKFDRKKESWELYDSTKKAEYVAVDDNGVIYIVSNLSVFYKDANEWIQIFDSWKGGEPVTTSKIILDKNNTLWFGITSKTSEIYSYKNNNLINHTNPDSTLTPLVTVDLCVDSNNNIWVVSSEDAKTYKYISTEDKWIKFDSTNSTLGTPFLFSKGISADNDSKVWLIPNKLSPLPPRFLTYHKNEEWKKFSIDEAFDLGAKDELYLLALAVDSKNNVWIGTNKGLIKFNETTTSVETSEANQIKIYPNPVGDLLTFDLEHRQANSYSVTDIFGRVLIKVDSPLTGSNKIEIRTLTSGTYFISFDFPNNETITTKFVKE